MDLGVEDILIGVGSSVLTIYLFKINNKPKIKFQLHAENFIVSDEIGTHRILKISIQNTGLKDVSIGEPIIQYLQLSNAPAIYGVLSFPKFPQVPFEYPTELKSGGNPHRFFTYIEDIYGYNENIKNFHNLRIRCRVRDAFDKEHYSKWYYFSEFQ